MERYRLRSALVFVFYKTSFTLGLLAGLSFAVPLLCGMYIGAEYQLLTLPLVFGAHCRHHTVRRLGRAQASKDERYFVCRLRPRSLP